MKYLSITFLSVLLLLLRSAEAQQSSSGDCSPNVSDITGNVTIVCKGSVGDYQRSVLEMSEIVNSQSISTQEIVAHVEANLDLINGSYVAPLSAVTDRYWTARQTITHPPVLWNGGLSPDFVVVDYQGPYSNRASEVVYFFFGPVNDIVYGPDGEPAEFTLQAKKAMMRLQEGDKRAMDLLQNDDAYRMPPLEFAFVRAFTIIGRRNDLDKNILQSMKERNRQIFLTGFQIITYDSFLELLSSRRL